MKRLTLINQILFFLVATSVLVYFGASFLIPLIFGIFFASLMTPVARLLERGRIGRILSSFICTIIVFVVVGGLLYLLSYQMSRFMKEFPDLISRLGDISRSLQVRIVSLTGLSVEEQQNIIKSRSDEIVNAVQSQITGFLTNLLNTAIGFLLALIYVFLFLMYRNKFLNFIMMYVDSEKEPEADVVVRKISRVVYQYLWGRAKVMTLLGLMYYITFLIYGLPFALLLTVFGAIVTIVPYLGPFISTVFPILFAIIYVEGSIALILFIILISVIQLIESYVLEPLIIGKEVKLNPFIVIIAVLLGGKAWGLAGMILFVPVFAIIKIISNHSRNLKPIGYLFGISK